MNDEKRNRVYNARRKLRARPRDIHLQHIASETGLTLEWLGAFARGKYPNPHDNKLAKLEEYLPAVWVEFV